MTATEALERRIDELCRENEQLRQQVASIIDRSFRTADKMDCLNTENTKLRKLCVKALEWLRWAGGITCPPEVPDEFADELRELGIEVD